MDPSHSSRP